MAVQRMNMLRIPGSACNAKLRCVAWESDIGGSTIRWLAVLFRIEQFGEARIFLKESEVFVVTGVIAIFRT